MKRLSCAIAIAGGMILAGCGNGVSPADDQSEGQLAAGRDSVGILDYTSSGRLDKVIPRKEDATTGSITIAVDESLKPIIEAEIRSFEFLFPDAEIRPLYLPGEEAIAAMLSSDSIRLAISTRELRPSEEDFLAKRSIAPKYAHLFSDAVAVVVNPELPLKALSAEELDGLLKGRYKTWKELNSQLPATAISLIVDNRASSVLMTLRERFSAGEAIPNTALYALDSTVSVLDHVASHPGAIGFVGYSWISDRDDPAMTERRKKVTLVGLEKSQNQENSCTATENFFLPFQSYIYQGCYPLSRKVVSVLRESTLGLGTGFVSFMDSPKGQIVIHKAGLATVHGIGREVKLPPKSELDNPTNLPESSLE